MAAAATAVRIKVEIVEDDQAGGVCGVFGVGDSDCAEGGRLYLRYDMGGIAEQMAEVDVTAAEVEILKRSSEEANAVILAFQNAKRPHRLLPPNSI